jgi:hypothetical protein
VRANIKPIQVFDNFAGTLRVPFEMRIGGGISPVKDMEEIEPHLFKIRSRESASSTLCGRNRNRACALTIMDTQRYTLMTA